MKKYLLAGVLVFLLAAILAVPLSAAEKESAKIKLPDGIYMYDSSVRQLQDGSLWVGFRKYFVVYNKNIYSPGEAVKKIGVSKLNKLFTENKKYKILFGGEQIGEIYSVIIEDGEEWNYKQNLFTNDIKQGPAYVGNKYSRTGSATMCLAVPEAYKEVKKIVYTTIPQEEVDRIGKLLKEKLYDLVKNRKEITEYQLMHSELSEEYIKLLDKISDLNGDLYMGIYRDVFKIEKGSRKFTPFLVFAIEIAFSVKKDNVYVITSDYAGTMKIQGMLDVDGDGEQEIIIEKVYGGLDEAIKKIELYKQKTDGNWTLIKKMNGGRNHEF